MANFKPENVKRFVEDISKVVAKNAYEGNGGTVVVNELPKAGEPPTISELHQAMHADFPWLLTDIGINTNYYPSFGTQFIVVENEEDVTYDNLHMRDTIEENHYIGVYVKNTNKVYKCSWRTDEVEAYVFEKYEIHPNQNKVYDVADYHVVLLSDFDYHVDSTGGTPTPDGTGHSLDGTEFNYIDGSEIVPLVLMNATNKKIGLSVYTLIGDYDYTEEPVSENEIVNKITLDVSNMDSAVFMPREAYTEVSYWYYSNDTWVNMDASQTTDYCAIINVEGKTFNPTKFLALMETKLEGTGMTVNTEVYLSNVAIFPSLDSLKQNSYGDNICYRNPMIKSDGGCSGLYLTVFDNSILYDLLGQYTGSLTDYYTNEEVVQYFSENIIHNDYGSGNVLCLMQIPTDTVYNGKSLFIYLTEDEALSIFD